MNREHSNADLPTESSRSTYAPMLHLVKGYPLLQHIKEQDDAVQGLEPKWVRTIENLYIYI